MQTPLVSIIIPTYNRAHLIGETLDSVLAQTYINWECIVVDDGSTDNTDKVLNMYCNKDVRFQYHYRPKDKPKGANACRNYGFELSKGAYVNWFDSDDVMLDDFLSIKMSKINKAKLIICSGSFVNSDLKFRNNFNFKKKTYLFKDFMLYNIHVFTPSILFKRSFLSNKNLFINNLFRGQELELFSRFFFDLEYEDIEVINSSLFLYRFHSNTVNENDKRYNKKYKESLSFVYLENLKRSIILHDKELINFFYLKLIGFLFRGIENKHDSNSKYILKNLGKSIFQINKILSFKLFFLGNILFLIRRGSYRIEKKFKNYKLFNS